MYLHITNGDVFGNQIKAMKWGTTVLIHRDVLYEGRVQKEALLDFTHHRAAHLAELQWGSFETIFNDFQEWVNGLNSYGQYQEIILWFEHDLHDQLQLIQLLSFFNLNRPYISLVQADDFLTQFSEADLLHEFQHRKVVTVSQFETAQRAWDAFTSKEAKVWFGLLKTDLSALPHLRAAWRRLCEEIPDPKTGLSRSERQILTAVFEINPQGPVDFQEVFRKTQTYETAIFAGDMVVWTQLKRLSASEIPLVKLEGALISLTFAGIAALEGQLKHQAKPRYLGNLLI